MSQRAFLIVPPLMFVAVGCFLVAALSLGGNVTGGMVTGTLLGQATVAGAWGALGPGRALVRIPLSLGWIVLLMLSLSLNATAPNTWGVLGFGWLMFGVWTIAQLGAMIVRVNTYYGVVSAADLRAWHVLIAIVLLMAPLVYHSPSAAAVFMGLPLLIAGVLRKHSMLAVAGVLLLIAIFTAWERTGFGWQNLFLSLWVLAFAIHIRLCGYRLGSTIAPATSAAA